MRKLVYLKKCFLLCIVAMIVAYTGTCFCIWMDNRILGWPLLAITIKLLWDFLSIIEEYTITKRHLAVMKARKRSARRRQAFQREEAFRHYLELCDEAS